MLRGAIMCVLSALCYGMCPILYKLGFRAGLAEMDMLQYRFISATLLILIFIGLKDRRLLRPGPKTIVRAAFCGVVLYCLQSTMFLKSLNYVPAATTSLILYIYPATVTLLSMIFFGLRISRTIAFSLVMILAGSALVSLEAFRSSADPRGVLFAAAAMLIFSVYILVNQRFMRDEKPLTMTLYVLCSVAVTFSILHNPTTFVDFTPKQLALCGLIGLIPTALAVPLLYSGIERIGGAYASIFSTFEPVATLIAASLLLDEPITMAKAGGMTLIITGILLPNLSILGLKSALARTAGD